MNELDGGARWPPPHAPSRSARLRRALDRLDGCPGHEQVPTAEGMRRASSRAASQAGNQSADRRGEGLSREGVLQGMG